MSLLVGLLYDGLIVEVEDAAVMQVQSLRGVQTMVRFGVFQQR
jgi:hypothetical protein